MGIEDTPEGWFVYAAADGDLTTAREFLAAGGDINAAPESWNALHYPIEQGQIEMITYLLEMGADPDAMRISAR